MLTNNTENYYSNGKLLLSGEYAVLDGATAFALPVNLGQTLEIKNPIDTNILSWEAYVNNKLWFFTEIDSETLDIVKTNIQSVAEILKNIIIAGIKLKPEFKTKLKTKIITRLNFNRDWGLGSSSTLISNIAYWAEIDPFILFNSIFKGSGYDIAAARTSKPFLYTLENYKTPIIEKVKFENNFLDSIYFVYLGNKQDSNNSIDLYNKNTKISAKQIAEISDISKQFSCCRTLDSFQNLMAQHEKIISSILNETCIKEKCFSDFDGSIKSLGAWGGDFVMVASKNNSAYVKNYFSQKQLNTIFNYNELAIR